MTPKHKRSTASSQRHKAGISARRWSARWLALIGLGLLLALLAAGVFLIPGFLRPGSSHLVSSNTVSVSLPANSNAATPSPFAATNASLPPMNDPVELLNFGTELLGRGQTEEAIQMYLQALKLNPEDEEVHFNLGFAYALQGRTDDAIRHYNEALKVFPDYVEAHNNLGRLLLDRRQYDEAIKHLSVSLQLMPENSTALNSLGRALAEQGQTKEAIVHFSEAVRLRPDYLEARCNLGNAYLSLGRAEEAVAQFSEALRLNPNFPPATRGMARAREKQAGKSSQP